MSNSRDKLFQKGLCGSSYAECLFSSWPQGTTELVDLQGLNPPMSPLKTVTKSRSLSCNMESAFPNLFYRV